MNLVKPMLAETGKATDLDRKDWLYEQKLDGVRCIALLNDQTKLQARSGSDITHKFPELAMLHNQVAKPCILDGEIIGRDFNAIQHRIHQEKPLGIKIAQIQYPAIYCLFDILFYDGQSLMGKPLIQRKAILNTVFAQDYHARLLEWQSGHGTSLFNETKEKELEGIMAKAIYSPYYEGKRSDNWLKIKNFKEATYYICGVTEGENERSSTFGSLILAEKANSKLTYVGNVGSGFSQDQLRMMLHLLEPLRDETQHFSQASVDRPIKFWVRPDLKCEVRYLELSNEGKLRFPTFRRLV